MRGHPSFDESLSRRQMLLRCANGFGAVALTALLTERFFPAPPADLSDI